MVWRFIPILRVISVCTLLTGSAGYLSGCAAKLNAKIPDEILTGRPPVLASISAQTVAQGKSISVNITATDPDGTIPTLSVLTNPTQGTATLVNSTLTYSANWVNTGSDSIVIEARDSTGLSSTATVNINVLTRAWLGGVATPSAWTTGGISVLAQSDGSLWQSNGYSGFFADLGSDILIASDNLGRLTKWVYSTGASVGWSGTVLSTPTGGDAGCTTTLYGNSTPGFCTGGAAMSGGYGLGGTYFDGTYFYSGSGQGTILRYNPVNGQITGWIGKVATTPTGGDPGCAVAAVGSITPGWCTGGSWQTGTEVGAFSGVMTVTGDGTYLYAIETNNFRVQRITIATGLSAGWIGRINAVATGDAAGSPGGCAATPSGNVTPGWCTGGTAQASAEPGGYATADGGFINPIGSYADGISLYIGERYKINRYDLVSGTFTGWNGYLGDLAPTGGDAGCAALVAFSGPMQRWCLGGRAQFSSAEGGFNQGYALTGDATYLYIRDGFGRLQRIHKNGTSAGWIGRISGIPTGGAAGCNTASADNATPGWCTGGSSTTGNYDGMFGGNGSYADGEYMAYNLQVVGANLLVGDIGNGRIQRFNAASGAFVDWIGAKLDTSVSGWIQSDLAPAYAYDDLSLRSPRTATAYNGSLYVPEAAGSRVKRYNLSTGAMTGWIGRVLETPTGGDAGCTATASSLATPGWCTGGRNSHGTSDGEMYAPGGTFTDGTYLYAIQIVYPRITRFLLSTGQFAGWTGRTAAVPTSDAAGSPGGCAATISGDITPGWCMGGTSNWGAASGDGMMSTPVRIAGNGTYFYVVDYAYHRVLRYSTVTGAFSGWIGYISGAATTGGDVGCAGAINQYTPGWCYGGASGSRNSLDGFNLPVDVSVYDTELYLADTENYRVLRITAATGQITGWIGDVGVTPTGGVAGCTATAPGNRTPGWCTGGTSAGLGSLIRVYGMAADSTALYFASLGEGAPNKILKHDRVTGAFVGWQGKVHISPTGGEAGCAGLAVDSITPGWCTGGFARPGYEVGGYVGDVWGSFSAISLDENYLYISDTRLHRIMRIPK